MVRLLAVSEFVLPEFLQVDEEEIHQRMLNNVPKKYDVSEGALFFDVTKPVAMLKAEMIGFNLSLALQMMFPQFAEGRFLDYHGESVRLPRHPAEKAKGKVTFTGDPGTVIQTGIIVMTVGTDDNPPISFVVTEMGTIDETGKVNVSIEALEAGSNGIVPVGSIILLERSIPGVSAVKNEEATSGGLDEESDEHYRERILDRRKNKALSGARRDYEAWAKEVPGVGDVVVIPEADGFGTGTTKVLITSQTGGVASQELIEAVQQHIAPDGRNGGGLAPIGALVLVGTVDTIHVDISLSSIELVEGYTEEEALDLFKISLKKYFDEVSNNGLIRYTHIGSLVVSTKAIKDYEGLLVNGSTENIQLTKEQIATVGEVTVTNVT